MQKLKAFLRRSTSRRKDTQALHAKPAQDLGTTSHNEQHSDTQRIKDRTSKAQASEASSHGSGNPHTNRIESPQCPRQEHNEPPIATTDYGWPDPEQIDSSVADNYRAYLPAVSPGDVADRVQYMSLGGDSRVRTGASELKHNEDIADRNIDMYGEPSSRHGSLPSQADGRIIAQSGQFDASHAARKASVGTTSVGSLGSPASIDSVPSKASAKKYTLGTGVATEGSLMDSILPHVESADRRKYERQDWPARLARDELRLNWKRRKPRRSSEDDLPRGVRRESTQESAESPYSEAKPRKDDSELINFRKAAMDGQHEYDSDAIRQLDGVVDLSNTEDVDKSTQWAPAVTHEVVKPHEHHIREEKIYREIHNYDVYHRIQPVFETEILPARHFIRDANNDLVEVSEDQLPDCSGENQRWFISEKNPPAIDASKSCPNLVKPRIIADETYTTQEGFERRETTVLHPQTLEDLSGYKGPVLPIHFLNKD